MVGELLNKARHFFKPKQEKILIIEENSENFLVSRVKVDNKSKKIHIKSSEFIDNIFSLKKPISPFDKIILALGSKKAATVENLISLKREDPDELINESELDTLVFRGLWEFLSYYRGWAAKKLGITDLNLVLAGAEIREVFLGPYRVFNPLGFKGPKLTLRYRGTFIGREIIGFIERVENWSRDFILVENGAVLNMSIPEKFDYFVKAEEKVTNVFKRSYEESLYFKSLPWGSNRLLGRLAGLFGIEPAIAYRFIDRLVKGETSSRISRLMEKEIKEETKLFLKLLRRNLRISSPLRQVFYFNFKLPLEVFKPLFKTRYMRLSNFRNWLINQDYGVIIDEERRFLMKGHESTLALISHIYSPPQYRFLNQLLKRRARWLVARS